MFQSANKQYRIPKLQQDPLWFTLPKPGHSSSFSVWFPHPSSWRRCSFFIVIIETSTATVPRCFRVFFHDMWNPPPKKHIYYWRIHRRNVPLTLSGVFRRRLFSLIWRLQNGVKARTMSILNTTGSAYASNGNPETKPFWRNQTKKTSLLRWRKITKRNASRLWLYLTCHHHKDEQQIFDEVSITRLPPWKRRPFLLQQSVIFLHHLHPPKRSNHKKTSTQMFKKRHASKKILPPPPQRRMDLYPTPSGRQRAFLPCVLSRRSRRETSWWLLVLWWVWRLDVFKYQVFHW